MNSGAPSPNLVGSWDAATTVNQAGKPFGEVGKNSTPSPKAHASPKDVGKCKYCGFCSQHLPNPASIHFSILRNTALAYSDQAASLHGGGCVASQSRRMERS